jgi:hypothetical protein
MFAIPQAGLSRQLCLSIHPRGFIGHANRILTDYRIDY